MKKGLKIFLMVLGIIVLILVFIGIYLYNFHVFKILRVCISDDAENLRAPCIDNEECIALVKESEDFSEIKKLPELLKKKVDEVLEEAIYCDGTCKMKRVYGMGLDGVEEVESCKAEEKEIIWEIKGKDALKFLSYL